MTELSPSVLVEIALVSQWLYRLAIGVFFLAVMDAIPYTGLIIAHSYRHGFHASFVSYLIANVVRIFVRQLRSPVLGISVGLTMMAVGLDAIPRGPLLLPTAGLFVALIGVRVVIGAAAIAGARAVRPAYRDPRAREIREKYERGRLD